MKYFLILSIALLSTIPSLATDTLFLHQNWEFKALSDSVWRSASVPGMVHMDLLKHELIPDPNIGTNEREVQWVEKETWQYRVNFELPVDFPKSNRELLFTGLDTYAEVILNGENILHSENMFRNYARDVSHLLQSGENSLLITFKSLEEVHGTNFEDQAPYHLTAANDQGDPQYSVYTRKAQFQFGWDWSLRLVTSGVWRPVMLLGWENTRLGQLQIYQESLTDDLATGNIQAEFWGNQGANYQLKIFDEASNQLLGSGDILEENYWSDAVPFQLSNPKKWWTHDLGEPHLYELRIEIWEGEELVEKNWTSFGFRTIELIQEEDAVGISYYFKLNGVPIFARGANYIPSDVLLSRIQANDRYNLLRQAKEANMNMLRVWGGGIYEADDFYQTCDELGILIWQDFMFACAMYPADPLKMINIGQEVSDNINRLRNHPCIALWCGNNEVNVAWYNWGWQKQHGISEEDSIKMKADYDVLFHQLLPGFVRDLDPGRPYVHTSPLSNWGKPENFDTGSMHYWGVWHGRDPFEGYQTNVGRFMSEYGFQSFPHWHTITAFADEDQWSLDSEVMTHHQKSYIGNNLIEEHVQTYFGPSQNFREFVYKSQLAQALGMKMAIEAHRSRQGHCMGSLFWQLNDSWPGPSWSAIDYYGRPKALYFQLAQLYQPISLVAHFESGTAALSVVNSTRETVKGTLRIQLTKFNGKAIFEEQKVVVIESGAVGKLEEIIPTALFKKWQDRAYLQAQYLDADGEVLSEINEHLLAAKELRMPKPKIQYEFLEDGITLSIRSKGFVKGVYLEGPEHARFSNNFFDLQPGVPVQVRIDEAKGIMKKDIRIFYFRNEQMNEW